ncbi:unnamed protein product [Mytilus edulis]|uniref:DZIP3-like HEPN domain-containing protein n=1 Tax=Mytilus edulis TaxID=6550 RepID=A0A8S3T3V5_MYTED|nr:unnamed protein product [Mytilus edulis]
MPKETNSVGYHSEEHCLSSRDQYQGTDAKVVPKPQIEILTGISLEDKNYLRTVHLLRTVASRAFRVKFDEEFNPSMLQAVLYQNRLKKIEPLMKKRVLTNHQWHLLYPDSAAGGHLCLQCDHVTIPQDCFRVVRCGTHEDCFVDKFRTHEGYEYFSLGCRDIDETPILSLLMMSLMVCLIRNLTCIQIVDYLPRHSEQDDSSNLTRLWYYQRKIMHGDADIFLDRTFDVIWDDICQAIIGIGGVRFAEKCSRLKVCSLESNEKKLSKN